MTTGNTKAKQKQIPFGNDNKKGKDKKGEVLFSGG